LTPPAIINKVQIQSNETEKKLSFQNQ